MISEVFKFEIVHRGVKIVAAKMIALDNAPSSSSATEDSSSSEGEIYELYYSTSTSASDLNALHPICTINTYVHSFPRNSYGLNASCLV